jgi:hypothetical protein
MASAKLVVIGKWLWQAVCPISLKTKFVSIKPGFYAKELSFIA